MERTGARCPSLQRHQNLIGIIMDVDRLDLEFVVHFNDCNTEQLEELSGRLPFLIWTCPFCPVPPRERYARGAWRVIKTFRKTASKIEQNRISFIFISSCFSVEHLWKLKTLKREGGREGQIDHPWHGFLNCVYFMLKIIVSLCFVFSCSFLVYKETFPDYFQY